MASIGATSAQSVVKALELSDVLDLVSADVEVIFKELVTFVLYS